MPMQGPKLESRSKTLKICWIRSSWSMCTDLDGGTFIVFFVFRHTRSHRGSSTSRSSRFESDSSSCVGVVGEGLRKDDVSGLVGALVLRFDFALSWSLAKVEKEDLGFDCARNESDFCVEPLGGIL